MSEPGSLPKGLRREEFLILGISEEVTCVGSVDFPGWSNSTLERSVKGISPWRVSGLSGNCFHSRLSTPGGANDPVGRHLPRSKIFSWGVFLPRIASHRDVPLKIESLAGDVCDGEVGFVLRRSRGIAPPGDGRRFRSVHRGGPVSVSLSDCS